MTVQGPLAALGIILGLHGLMELYGRRRDVRAWWASRRRRA